MSLEVYHFARGVSGAYLDYVRRLQGDGDSAVRFTTSLLGPWDSLTIIDVADDAGFEAALDAVIDINAVGASSAGADGSAYGTDDGSDGNASVRPLETTTAVAFRPGIFKIRRRFGRNFEAFVQISAIGSMMDVFGLLPNLDGYEGSALVTGMFDMLLLLGANSLDELRDNLEAMAEKLEDRATTVTCYRVTAFGTPEPDE
jgi:hypothetical protein